MTEGDETVLLYSQDLLYGYTDVTDAVSKISKATGVPKDHIMISGTHTHSAPSLYTNKNSSEMKAYLELYCNAMVTAAKNALADRGPATLYGTDVKTKGMNFVRHYVRQGGTITGSNFGTDSTSPIKDHISKGDPNMRLIKMVREGGKQDILLMNFQAHPTFTDESGKGTALSADFVGTTRDKIEADTDMLFIYFSGASGDQVKESAITEKKNNLSVRAYGQTLGQYAIDALDSMKKIDGSGIKTTKASYRYNVNKDGLDKLEQAKEIVSKWSTNNSAAKSLLKEYKISSIHEANAIIARESWPDSGTMELNVIYAGGMAFVVAPYEMFSASGMYIKEKSPFDMTVICTTAGSNKRYYATKEAYDYGSYEAVTSYFERGCAEDTVEKFIKMLKGLK